MLRVELRHLQDNVHHAVGVEAELADQGLHVGEKQVCVPGDASRELQLHHELSVSLVLLSEQIELLLLVEYACLAAYVLLRESLRTHHDT